MKYGILYVDYDGVLVNFRKAVEAKVGQSIESQAWDNMNREKRNKLYSEACDSVEFWANLEPMPDYQTLWGYVKYWNPNILTAYPMWSSKAKNLAIRGKELWNRKHTMVPDNRFHCVERKDKQLYAINNGTPNVLIDDNDKNISEWESKGGTGILHKNAVSTITQLKLLGFRKQ